MLRALLRLLFVAGSTLARSGLGYKWVWPTTLTPHLRSAAPVVRSARNQCVMQHGGRRPAAPVSDASAARQGSATPLRALDRLPRHLTTAAMGQRPPLHDRQPPPPSFVAISSKGRPFASRPTAAR